MPADRIVEPSEVSEIIRDWLSGDLTDEDAAYRALRLAGSSDRVLAGHQTPAVLASCWALRRLMESASPARPDRDRMTYLLECVEGRKRFLKEREPL